MLKISPILFWIQFIITLILVGLVIYLLLRKNTSQKITENYNTIENFDEQTGKFLLIDDSGNIQVSSGTYKQISDNFSSSKQAQDSINAYIKSNDQALQQVSTKVSNNETAISNCVKWIGNTIPKNN